MKKLEKIQNKKKRCNASKIRHCSENIKIARLLKFVLVGQQKKLI